MYICIYIYVYIYVCVCVCVCAQIQGAIMVAALLEVVLGASGAIGVLLRFIGPLSICPTVALLGMSLFKSAANFAGKQWWIASL